jgi:hypothetical protein
MVWICDRCEKGKHQECKNRVSCDCQCNINGINDIAQKAFATVGGIGLAVGGLALTVFSGGLLIPVGGAMMGAGISSTFQGVEKTIKNERISGTGYCADVAFGAVTGVLTGGIGAAGEAVATNVAKQGAKEVVKVGAKKLVIRTAAGGIAGITSKAVDEVKMCTTTDKKWSDFGKTLDKNGEENGTATSWAMSAVVGGLGGVGGHISSNATKQVSSGVTKSAIRIGVSGTSAAVGDTAVQAANIAVGNQDEFDPKRTVTTFAASSITAAAYEGAQNGLYKLGGGKEQVLLNKANKEMIEKNVPEADRKEVLENYEKLKKIPKSTLENEAKKADAITNHIRQENNHKTTIANYDKQIKQTLDSRQAAINANNKPLIKQHQQNLENLLTEKAAVIKDFNANKPTITKADIQYMNEKNAHVLVGDKNKQVATDVGSSNPDTRGNKRAVFDYDTNGNKKHGEYKFAGYTDTHDYKTVPNSGESNFQQTHSNCNNDLRMIRNVGNNLICNQIIDEEEKDK